MYGTISHGFLKFNLMKNTIVKESPKGKESSARRLELKKEAIHERSEKLDPNNEVNQQKPLLKGRSKRKLRDDGFEHRSSKDTTDTI